MDRKILCYYCPKCTIASHNSFCRCGKLCYVYTDERTVEPNYGYVSENWIKAKNDDGRYCPKCKVSSEDASCPTCKTQNWRLWKEYYVCPTVLSGLSRNRFYLREDEKKAIEECRKFVDAGSCTKKCMVCKKLTIAGSHCHRQPEPLDGSERICIVCKKIVGTKKHCERYTKMLNGRDLIPDTRYFPIYSISGLDYMGNYYCWVCKHGGDDFICECGRNASHRWYENQAGKGYVLIPDLVDYKTRTTYRSHKIDFF